MPQVLYEEVVEVEERIALHKDQCCLKHSGPVVRASTGEDVTNRLHTSQLVTCVC